MLVKKIFSKQNRALLRELVVTDFKLRYQGSVLGYMWSLLKPLLMFVILYTVFVRFLKIGGSIPHYPVYLLLGIVMWNFFTEMAGLSLGSIVGRGDLIRKIRISRWIIVVSSSLTALINFALNLLVVGILMAVNHVDLLHTGLLLPLIFIEVYLFSLGISLLLAALYVKFRDINHIWDVCIQALFYLTPILYPLSLITNPTLQKIILLNPMAQAIQDARYVVVTHQTITLHHVTNLGLTLIPFVLVALVLVSGVLYFKREAKYFAENI
ncbi:MAG TPA: ABC transporter permease [Bacillota bacterium]|nr:ABC transporter permease [Bacillota bacterium]